MKKIFLSLGVAGMLGMASCSEDFEVAAPYQSVTVVYGIWDKEDTAHYVRIQKAFLDENKSAVDMAKVSDSSFFRDLTVLVREISGSKVTTLPPLQRVDLVAEGYMKDSASNEQGFFRTPHYGYKLKKDLDPANRYRLVIINNETGNIDSSEIAIVGTPTHSKNSLPSKNTEIAFSRITARYPFRISGDPRPANARYYELIMRFHYYDVNSITRDSTARYIDFNAGRSETLDYTIPHKDIYNALVEKIGPAPSNIERRMTTVDFLMFAGGNELYQYELLANAQGGLTNDQIRPNFTNILGKNTIGLLASKAHSISADYPISQNTVDSLMKNDLTKPLNIQK